MARGPMSRGIKILIGLAATLVVLVVIAVVFIATFDWNRARPMINDKVSTELNRPFAINGDLTVQWRREPGVTGWRGWVPWPNVTARDITLGNPDWAETPRMASLAAVEARLSPLPLIARRVVIPQIQLTGPTASLQRLADGRANWNFSLPAKEGDEAKTTPWDLDIGTIGFDTAKVELDDAVMQAKLSLAVDPLGEPIPFSQLTAFGNKPAEGVTGGDGKPRAEAGDKAAAAAEDATDAPTPGDYAFGWKMTGSYKAQKVSGEGKVGGLLALQDAATPFPLQADLRAGATRVRLAGTLTDPMKLGALDLRLALSGNSMADLYALTGVTLPDTPPYSTDGRLRADLHNPAGAVFDYSGFNGKVGDSDLHGDIRYAATQPRPKLTGKLRSDLLQLADLGPLIGLPADGADKADSKEKAAQAKDDKSGQPAGKVLPYAEFRTDRWRAMDADVSLTGKRIVHSERLPLTDLNARLILEDGTLRLMPLRFGVAGGSLDAAIRLDGGDTPLRGRIDLQARSLALKQLFPGFEPMRTSLGEINGKAAIDGTGNSVAALLGTANGSLSILINDGAISRGLTEIAGLNVANYLITTMFGDDTVKINCAAADMRIEKGVMHPRIFLFDTENALVEVEGPINLRDETLDLDITPHSKGFRIFSLRSPLYVRGTFANPKAGVHTGPLLARGAGMVALGALLTPSAGLLALIAPSVGEDNACTQMVEDMKQRGRKAPAKR